MSNYFTKDDAVDIILDTLNDNPNIYPEEIFERSFNEDYYIIGYYKAEQALRNSQWGIFGAIGLISNYEQSEFGEVNTDLSDCEKVANMLEYIIGEDVWADIQDAFEDETGIDLNDQYGDGLDDETQDKLIDFIKSYRKEIDPSFDHDFDYLINPHVADQSCKCQAKLTLFLWGFFF